MHWKGLELPCAHRGLLLRVLREHRSMSALGVVAALEAHGYAMRVAAYLQMEVGVCFPDDGERFIRAYRTALRLAPDEQHLLVAQWGFDLLCQEFGEAFAREIVEDLPKGERRVTTE